MRNLAPCLPYHFLSLFRIPQATHQSQLLSKTKSGAGRRLKCYTVGDLNSVAHFKTPMATQFSINVRDLVTSRL